MGASRRGHSRIVELLLQVDFGDENTSVESDVDVMLSFMLLSAMTRLFDCSIPAVK